MPGDAKVRIAVLLGGAMLILLALLQVTNTLGEPTIESTHAYYIDSNAGDDSNSGR